VSQKRLNNYSRNKIEWLPLPFTSSLVQYSKSLPLQWRPKKGSTLVGQPCMQMLDVNFSGKHSGLLWYSDNYGRKKFNSRGPWTCQKNYTGNAKANGREPKSCLCRVFNSKLDRFVPPFIKSIVHIRILLELKTLLRVLYYKTYYGRN